MGSKILVLGDICLKSGEETDFVDASVREIIQEHEIVTCDMGIVVPFEGMRKTKKAGPHELQHPISVKRSRDAGINLARLAGNHIMDYGMEGARYFMEQLELNGIGYVGTADTFHLAYEPVIMDLEGVKTAFFSVGEMGGGCACEDGQPGYAWVNSHELETRIRAVRDQVDYVFLFVHAGVEDMAVPMMEWRDRYRSLVDLGCDFVIAAHPHIIQGVERYGRGLIAYSLGNFAYDMIPSCTEEEWNTSIMISFDLKKNGEYKYQIYPVRYDQGMVLRNDKDEKFRLKFRQANRLLQNKELYKKELDRVCLDFFERYYYAYYTRYAVQNGRIDSCFLLHNIEIESNSYLCSRALRIRMRNEQDLQAEQAENPCEAVYLLWGAGDIGRRVLKFCKERGLKVACVTDSRQELWGTWIEGYQISPLTEVQKLSDSGIKITGMICTNIYYGEIRYRMAVEYGFQNCIPWEEAVSDILKWEIEHDNG